MGIVLSRWRKQPSTLEQLELLDKEIKSLELKKRTNLVSQKKVIGSLVLYSVIGYVIAVIVFYYMYLPEEWSDRVIYSSPLLAFPLLVWLTKKLLHWYFVRQITHNDSSLENARERRKTILDEVMEKETYKKAKEILEKFDPDSLKSIQDKSNKATTEENNEELRQRNGSTSASPSKAANLTLNQSLSTSQPNTPMRQPHGQMGRGLVNGPPGTPRIPGPPGPPMPRVVLPRDRSIMDRLVEGLVGDGPQNRYALICQECCSHNGMALKEEFEYIGFRCCYCYRMNPARKIRAHAPRLDLTPAMTRRSLPEKTSRNPDLRTTVANGNQVRRRPIEDIPAESRNGITEETNQEEDIIDPAIETPVNHVSDKKDD